MVADGLDYVIGVDTHLDEHVLAIVAAPSGAVVARRSIQASARGYAAALRFAAAEAKGARIWAIEGTGSYGAGLARFLAGRRETVLEISRTPRAERRLRGKDDSLDATRTARAALASETLALPRSVGPIVAGTTARRLVTPRPAPLGSRLRTARRSRARASIKRQDNAAPTQPWRRPTTQPSAAHGRPAPPPARPGNKGLHRATDR